ncbi:MAG: glycosyltransferase [Anaerolineae bacterium]|nr:glycosyltransferase [Anaerolineae bacterium]
MSNRPLRVLHVINAMNRGGIETWLMNILRNADPGQFTMDFLVQTAAPCDYGDEIRAHGSRLIPCLYPANPLRYAQNFKVALKTYGPYDIVHSHAYWFSGYVLHLAKSLGIPGRIAHIYPVEDLKNLGMKRRIYQKLMGYGIRGRATGILADSQAAMDAFMKLCDCRHLSHEVIYPVVDLSAFRRQVDRAKIRRKYDLPLNIPIVLYVARFEPHKNHQGFLEIARLVNQSRKVAHFVMVGSQGRLMESLKALVAGREDVTMLINPPDVSEIMLAGDLFLFPSLHEGFGIVSIEAQASGLPVVASRLPSIVETLAPPLRSLTFASDETGLPVAADTIHTILTDDVYRAELSHTAREWVTHTFDIKTNVAQLWRFYQTGMQKVFSG